MNKRNSVLLASLCLVTGAFIARLPVTLAHIRSMAGTSGDEVNWSAALEDVLTLIRERYVEEPKEADILKGAIQGATEALNDPYTEFIPPADKAAFEKELTGQFVGIGATVNSRDGWLTIIYPLEQSPAYRAGLLPGDQVRMIDGKSTKGLRTDECVKLLLGEPGTEVKLTVNRTGRAEEFEVPIKRGPIAARAVKGFRFDPLQEEWSHLIDPERRLAYVRIDQFTPSVAKEFRGALRATLAKAEPKGLIIDLRDNPGGLMDQAIEIVDLFLESGTIVSTRGRAGAGEVYKATAGSLGDIPVVILVNQSSASASEIVAGAMAENDRAVVIGTRTFGKGLVQRVERLLHVPDAQLKLTEQHYYLPSGRLIQRTDKSKVWGVDPTEGFYVPLSDDQQRALWELRREMETVRPPVMVEGRRQPAPVAERERALAAKVNDDPAKWADPSWVEQTAQDPQLAAALRALSIRLASGTWEPTGKAIPDQVTAIASVELARLEKERERMQRVLDRVDDRIDALASGKVGAGAALRKNGDLWPDADDVNGGRLEVYDKAGKLIARLDITGPDVERWLLDADVKPHAEAKTEPGSEADGKPTGEKP